MASEIPVLPLVGSRMVAPGRNEPSASTSRSLRPGLRASMSSITADSVFPSPWTALAPPVNVRRIVGIRTSTAINLS